MLTTEALVAEIPEEKKALRWVVVDTAAAAAWETCTKSSISSQPEFSPASRRGFFFSAEDSSFCLHPSPD